MIRAYLSALFALSAVSNPAAACEIGAGTILAIPSADSRFALLDVREPSEGREARVCLQVARCRWEWKPSDVFLAWIKNQNPAAENCDARLALVDDVNHARRLTCPLSASAARPFVFASHLLGAQGGGLCSSAPATTTPDAVRAQAKLRFANFDYCIDLQWSFPTKSLLVSFAPTCDLSKAPESAPASSIGVRVTHPKASIAFDVKPSRGESWVLESVSTQPSTPYLSRWASAVRNLEFGGLTPPEDSLNSRTQQDAMQLPDLIGHWTLAMLLAGRSTNEDLSLRLWMSELELGNYNKAKNTLLRTECIEPTDVSSCQPQ